jgi:uncharacterized protein
VIRRSAPGRIEGLDVLRGFALLGILVLNIQSFGLGRPAYMNPTTSGDLGGANFYAWVFTHVFFELKFLTLYCVVFGASVALARQAWPTFLRRQLLLIPLGLLHGYLVYHGDILASYALCGLAVFPLRRLSVRRLLRLGSALIAIPPLGGVIIGLTLPWWPEQWLASAQASWAPAAETVAAEIAAYRGSFVEQVSVRVPTAVQFQTVVFFMVTMWKASGLMLIGMALVRLGILTGRRSAVFYRRLSLGCAAVGLPLVLGGTLLDVRSNWAFGLAMPWGYHLNYVGGVFLAGAYLGAVMGLSLSLIHITEPTRH